jgi:NAD-dependent DNA ligase
MSADPHRFNAGKDTAKRIESLLGIISGVMADGIVNDSEIYFLRTWLSQNRDLTQHWPASVISQKIEAVLADGQIDEAERNHLHEVFSKIASGDFSETGSADAEPIQLPLNDQAPLLLDGAKVCHTGEFLFGTRSTCERLTARAGGLPVATVTKSTTVLVVGTRVSTSWVNTSFGRKIEAAVALQESGHPILIVSEQRWLSAAHAQSASD